MRNKILLVVILLLPPALFLFFWWNPGAIKMPPASGGQTAQDAAVNNALAAAPTQANTAIASSFAAPPQTVFYSAPTKPPVAPAGKPEPLEFTNFAPEIALDKLRHVIRDYGSTFGGNPVGVNAEITSQLGGQNPKQVNFINAEEGMRVNAARELIDPWGTPYFFHQLSGKSMEIHSAGPDRVMWTADDVVVVSE